MGARPDHRRVVTIAWAVAAPIGLLAVCVALGGLVGAQTSSGGTSGEAVVAVAGGAGAGGAVWFAVVATAVAILARRRQDRQAALVSPGAAPKSRG